MDVSIIIVNYNTKELLRDCLTSIFEKTKELTFEVIVSDNGSTDGSIEMLHTDFPNVITLENRANLGFGKANNKGVEIAKGKYLFLLNSDTILLNNAIKYFFEYAELHNNLILGSYLIDKNGKVISSYGNFVNKITMIKKIFYVKFPFLLKIRLSLFPLNIQVIEKEVDFITGADLFISKDNFSQLQGFDENIFMYCEDEDLCLRALQKNIKSKIITTPKIIHLEGQSSKVSKLKKKILLKSYKYFSQKHL